MAQKKNSKGGVLQKTIQPFTFKKNLIYIDVFPFNLEHFVKAN